jgi:membrane protein DedA with SNARE-associated domain
VNITEQLLAAFVLHGLPVLFGVALIASIGFPLPCTLLLIAAGSFVEQGEMDLGWVLFLASVGAILGDQIGYGVGRWSGRGLVNRVVHRAGGDRHLRAAEASAEKWGGAGIFLSRWLFAPLGPWVNLTSGVTLYSYPRFLFWDISGEVVWVVLYVMIGMVFSDRIEMLAEMMGNLVWVLFGIMATLFFGWRLFKHYHSASTDTTYPAAAS